MPISSVTYTSLQDVLCKLYIGVDKNGASVEPLRRFSEFTITNKW